MPSVARHRQASAVAIADHGSRNSGDEDSWDRYSSFCKPFLYHFVTTVIWQTYCTISKSSQANSSWFFLAPNPSRYEKSLDKTVGIAYVSIASGG
jgi:hypothetical protein